MDLILWRHAEAVEWAEGCDDMQRPLTSRGEKQAHRMAQWLDRQLPEQARVVCSPARRTEQTVLALGRKYKLREELSPNGIPEQLLELVQWPKGKVPMLVVGHQPTLGQTVSKLLGLKESEISMKKGAVWWLRCRERDGHLQTVVVTVQTPDLL
jgi:phosphohistidine phosphatase